MERFSLVRAAIKSALVVCALPAAIAMTMSTAQTQPAPPLQQCAHSRPSCPANSMVACTAPGRCLDRGGRPVQGCRQYGCEQRPERPPPTSGGASPPPRTNCGGGADECPPSGPQPPAPGGWVPTRSPLCAAAPKCGARRVAVCVEHGRCTVVGPGRPYGCRQYACVLRL